MFEPVFVEAEHAAVMRIRRDRSDATVIRDDCWHLRGDEAVTYATGVRAQDADRRNYWTTEAITRAVRMVLNQLRDEDDLERIAVTITVSDLVVTAAITKKES